MTPIFSFRPNAELELQAGNTALPGDRLPLEVRANLHEKVNLRQVRAELVGEETYYVKESYTDSKGHIQTRIVKRVEAFHRTVSPLADNPSLVVGGEQRWSNTIFVPLDAPPTCLGKVVDVRWKLRAVLDVPMHPDKVEEFSFQVRAKPPDVNAAGMNSQAIMPAEKDFGECKLVLDIPRVAAAGDALLGNLRLETKQKFQIRGIRIELVQAEDAGARRSDEVVVRQDVSGAALFNPYENPSFDFSLAIPADAPPTMRSSHSSLQWQVKAVLDRRLRTDFAVQQGIYLYNAPESVPEKKGF